MIKDTRTTMLSPAATPSLAKRISGTRKKSHFVLHCCGCCAACRCTGRLGMVNKKRIILILVFVTVMACAEQHDSTLLLSLDASMVVLVSAFFVSSPLSSEGITSLPIQKKQKCVDDINKRGSLKRCLPRARSIRLKNFQARKFMIEDDNQEGEERNMQSFVSTNLKKDEDMGKIVSVSNIYQDRRDALGDDFAVNGDNNTTISNPYTQTSSNNQQQIKDPLAGGAQSLEETQQQMEQWTEPTLAIAIPALIGMIADPLLSLMDTLYVSKLLGSIELAALGACTSIFHLAFNVFRATTAATTSLVASELNAPPVGDDTTATVNDVSAVLVGSSRTEDDVSVTDTATSPSSSSLSELPEPTDAARYVLSTTFQFSSIVGFVVALTLIFTSTFSLKCMGIPQTSPLFRHATSYLRLRALAAPAVLFITVGEGAFRGYGDTRIPLLASMAAALTNAVLDPVLMFPPFQMGVGGAAAATALSQVVAMIVYIIYLQKRRMCMPMTSYRSLLSRLSKLLKKGSRSTVDAESITGQKKSSKRKSSIDRKRVIQTIVEANVSMLLKQFSLLFCWAYATSRATNIGHVHVASHQVALSLWLVFALLQDGAAVASQVLMGRVLSSSDIVDEKDSKTTVQKTSTGNDNIASIRSLTKYMVRLALIQSAVCSLSLLMLQQLGAPTWLSTDGDVIQRLQSLMPTLMWFQPLVSLTLTLEGIATGAKYFGLLARGTLVATVISMCILRQMNSVEQIWKYGLTSLFFGRCITALIGVFHLNEVQSWRFKRWRGQKQKA